MAGDRYIAGSITWSSSGDTVTIEIGSGDTTAIMEMTLRDGVLMYNEALDIGSYGLKFARLQLGDVNGDGIVDPVDASLILVHNAGQVDDLALPVPLERFEERQPRCPPGHRGQEDEVRDDRHRDPGGGGCARRHRLYRFDIPGSVQYE